MELREELAPDSEPVCRRAPRAKGGGSRPPLSPGSAGSESEESSTRARVVNDI